MLKHNTKRILKKMVARKGAVTRELSRAARQGALRLSGVSKQILQVKVYNVPIPLSDAAEKRVARGAKLRERTTKGREGAWQRTGALKRAETSRTVGPTIILANNQRYALYRYRLGTSEGRVIRSPGVQSVQWQLQAVKQEQGFILRLRREAVLRGLERG